MEHTRILLVDDEGDFRTTIAKRLVKRGMEVEQAGSGEESLVILQDKPVDVVILDVKMPGMGGIETLHRIKEKYPGGGSDHAYRTCYDPGRCGRHKDGGI